MKKLSAPCKILQINRTFSLSTRPLKLHEQVTRERDLRLWRTKFKSLADQSKNATQQVRQILEDTRKWVTAVVMATEEGSKAVDAGVNQSVAAGESIRLLSQSVSSSAQSAAVIDSSSAQQFVGVDQVSAAMANIEQQFSRIW